MKLQNFDILQTMKTGSEKIAKMPWNNIDDSKLLSVIETYGLISWSEISVHVSGRSAKQCRER